MPKRPWKQPTGERDALPTARRPLTQNDGVPTDPFDELESCTPPPVEISPEIAYAHATAVQKRTADMLSQIAHSSGVGLSVGDELREVRRLSEETAGKLKRWQALAMSALAAAGASAFGVAKGLYDRGAQEGAAVQRMQNMEVQLERQRLEIETLRDRLSDQPRYWNKEKNQ